MDLWTFMNLEQRKNKLQNMKEDIQNEADDTNSYPSSCLGISMDRKVFNFTVKVPGLSPFPVMCNSEIAGNGWLVIQRRKDGSVNFYRDWNDYKNGFGQLDGEFFIGLDKLHALTASQPFELYVQMESIKGIKKYARYDDFAIGNESELYALNVLGNYSGTAGDSMEYHKGQKFSTFDRDYDMHGKKNCAEFYVGAWWYKKCHYSNLNGQYMYHGRPYAKPHEVRYICWSTFEDYRMLKSTQMMIRPKFGCGGYETSNSNF
ncbi:microfibril-associated glycoprotein 4-like [Scaptodrosophila lebanonensis]|uniref:Microfibril-associated glycoprotein 4-like n=1 Tax=Drosophila lebanonensis TaxID=7225 RepID=A0A6J2UI30_DROLE|nr:microfibril-associated glycoprotein 4-like [Scaptodrosophila lebanonensis]